MATTPLSVAEMQGLYGPFTLAERVVQKIWLQQDFAVSAAQLLDGRQLTVLHPGRWNLQGGPDFRRARLRIGGEEVTGDVEVHFHATDWRAHGHGSNPAYHDVVLHVLLFPPPAGARSVRQTDGRALPCLVLLPLLHRDLEEYAADDALEVLTSQDEARRVAGLLNRPHSEVLSDLRDAAAKRWERKVRHARQRIARLGWESAAHHTALEILGYRHNRVPMLFAAERWPLAAWSVAGVDEEVFRQLRDRWQRHGIRPANQPSRRLAQYAAWCAPAPDWPERLLRWADQHLAVMPAEGAPTGPVRRQVAMASARNALEQSIVGRSVSAGRLHTLVTDGFLPLLAAQRGHDLAGWWFHWYPGDLPAQVRRSLGGLGVVGGPECPWCNGWAQGLLGWLIERERSA